MTGGDMIVSLARMLDAAEQRGKSADTLEGRPASELAAKLIESEGARGLLAITLRKVEEALDFSQYGTMGFVGAPRGALENAIRAAQRALKQTSEDERARNFENAWRYWLTLTDEQRQNLLAMMEAD